MADTRCRFTVKDREGDETFLYSEESGFYMVPKAPLHPTATLAWANVLHATFDLRLQNPDPQGVEYAAIKRLAALMSDPKTPLDMQAEITKIIIGLTHTKTWLKVEIFGDDAHGDG